MVDWVAMKRMVGYAAALAATVGLCVAPLVSPQIAFGSAVPLSALTANLAPATTDLVPDLPLGATSLESVTILQLEQMTSGAMAGASIVSLPGYTCTVTGTTGLTITCTLSNQAADAVFAGPCGGAAASPTWRALCDADIPGVTINAQSGTSYTIAATDRDKLITFANAAATAVALPQAGSSFPATWRVWVTNEAAGAVTITPATSTIDGAATLVLTTGQGAMIVSDGTNYYSVRGGAPTGAANLVEATPSGAPGTAALRALVIPDLPASGVTAGVYSSPVSVTVNGAGQVTGIVGGQCTTSCSMPALASFTWVNQGGASAAQPVSGGPIGISQPDSGVSLDWRGLFQSVPTCPWKLTVALQASAPDSVATTANGLYLYDGTKLIGWESLLQGPSVSTPGFFQRVEHITNVTTDGSGAFIGKQGWGMRNDFVSQLFIQIRDDCTNYYFDSSVNGVVYYNLYSEAVGAYLTATKIGVGAIQVQSASSPLFLSLNSWQFFSNANLNGP